MGLPDLAAAQGIDQKIQKAAAAEGKLSVMFQTSASPETANEIIKKFNARYAFLDVSFTINSTYQVMNRFTAELSARRVVTDCVMLPSNLSQTNKYLNGGAIGNYTISQDAAFTSDAKHTGLWYAWTRETAVTAYRKNALSPEEKKLIRTYKGLGDPRFKGRLGINGITNSVTVTGAYALHVHPDQSLWRGLVANKPRVKATTPALIDGLLSGEYDVALFSAWASTANPAKTGAPLEFGNTALTPVLYVPGAIPANAPHPNAARLWQDWITSKEGQDVWASVTGATSARADAVKPWVRQQPWFFEDPKTHKPIDWDDFTKKEAEVTARFRKDFQAA
jgi:ABC-type Fe3+ transport system substrate-binding protein